jgi:hypothetical protein
LYRSVKIKAFIILLAWAIVFLHGVIPHIHMSEQHGLCHSLLHDSDLSEKGAANSDNINGSHNAHEKVCHFSTILYMQQGFEDQFANTSHKPQIIPEAIIISVIACDQDAFISLAETTPSLLRGPPVA